MTERVASAEEEAATLIETDWHAEADDAIEAEWVSLIEPGKGEDESRREKVKDDVGVPERLPH